MTTQGNVRNILNGNLQVAYRPAQVYSSVTGAYTIFSVTGGPIEAVQLFGYITAAAGGAVTVAGTLNGVAGDAGAAVISGAVGTVVWYPLNVGGTILNAAAIPQTLATAPNSMIVGTQPAGPGLIVMTYAISTATMSWTLVYRKLTPASRIV
jgi:hypothetical protein